MKLRVKWKAMMLFLAIAAAGILAACSAGGQEPPPSQEPAPAPAPGQEQEIDPDKEVLVFAQLSESNSERSVRRDVIDRFNRTHDDVQIVVKDYSDDQGPDRLLVEMASGQVPDIIDRGGSLPFHQMVKKGYLEDLWPYIENDPELGREGVLENPLKLSEVDGGLYMLFGAVEIETLIGSAEVVGDRTSWTLRDLQDAFAAMPEGSTVLSFDTSRSAISGSLLRYAAGAYVDREAGTCSFDNPSFRSMLEFIQTFPTSDEVDKETAGRGSRRACNCWRSPIFCPWAASRIGTRCGADGAPSSAIPWRTAVLAACYGLGGRSWVYPPPARTRRLHGNLSGL